MGEFMQAVHFALRVAGFLAVAIPVLLFVVWLFGDHGPDRGCDCDG